MRFFAVFFALLALTPRGMSAPASAAPAKTQTPPLRWVFRTRRDAEINPHTDVFLRVGPRQVSVMRQVPEEFCLAAKTDCKVADIPPQALAACVGRWADADDYLYVIQRGRSLVVYRREVDPQGPASSWKRLKTIPLP